MSLTIGSPEAKEILEADRALFSKEQQPTATIDCSECSGRGYHEMVCGECGHDYERDCEECDGTGKLTEQQKRKQEKESLRMEELIRLRRWNTDRGILEC